MQRHFREGYLCERKIPGPGFCVRKVAFSELRIPGPGFLVRKRGLGERGPTTIPVLSSTSVLDSLRGIRPGVQPGGFQMAKGVAEGPKNLSRFR